MDKLNMQTKNIADENYATLAKLFPNALTEKIVGYDENGKAIVERAIDADVLRQEISCSVVEGREERYQFTWPDKKKALVLANSPISATLRPCKEESVDFDNTENLYIEGDNLDVLKLLHETYLNRVKMIYIDPPYNTGKDFIYSDVFTEEVEEYFVNSVQKDEEGNKLVTNVESNGRFHTDWLNMMYSRIKIAKELLAQDGIMFVSIDDNEMENLTKICNEIFGANNKVVPFIWSLPRGINAGLVARAHEYILCYAKDINAVGHFNNIDEENSISIERCNKKIDSRHPESIIEFKPGIRYEGPDKDISGVIEGAEKITIIGTMKFRNGQLVEPVCLSAGWTMKNMIQDWMRGEKVYDLKGQPIEEFFFKANGKLYSKKKVSTVSIKSLLRNIPDTQKARVEMEALFGSQDVFSYPKPTELVKLLAKLSTNDGDIIMDFFSGSATSADAIMQLNAEENTRRRYIMVQVPEHVDEKSDAGKMGLNTICDIGRERIRRAGEKILNETYDQKNIKHGLKSLYKDKKYLESSQDQNWIDMYCKGEISLEVLKNQLKGTENNLKEINEFINELKLQLNIDTMNIDLGFRVLKLDSSNMRDIYYNPAQIQQQSLFESTDNIKEDRTPEDLLFQVMLDLGVLLSSKIEEKVIAGKKVFNVADGFLMACFDTDVTEETVKAVAQEKPYYAVFRDSSMANDSVATNFEQIFATYSPQTVRKVL